MTIQVLCGINGISLASYCHIFTGRHGAGSGTQISESGTHCGRGRASSVDVVIAKQSKGGQDQETFLWRTILGFNAQSNFPWVPSCSTGGCGCSSRKGEKGPSKGRCKHSVQVIQGYQRYITSFSISNSH